MDAISILTVNSTLAVFQYLPKNHLAVHKSKTKDYASSANTSEFKVSPSLAFDGHLAGSFYSGIFS